VEEFEKEKEKVVVTKELEEFNKEEERVAMELWQVLFLFFREMLNYF